MDSVGDITESLSRNLSRLMTLDGAAQLAVIVLGVIFAMHLLGWLPIVAEMLDAVGITVGSTRVSLLSVSELILMVAAFMLAAGWLSTTLERRLKASSHVSKSVRVGIVKFVRLFLYTLAGMLALNAAGIDLTTLAVFSGALGVGIGFGLKSIVSNFISGFILLFDRSIRPGDVIHIGDRFGWVKSLRARYVVIRDRDGVEVLIPNENLITSEVTNWSYSDRRVRLKLPVQISYSDEPEEAMGLLLQAAEGHGRLLREPPPQARLIGFGDNGIDLELRVWIRDPESGVGNIRSDINLSIWRLFKQHCVTIPFPQRDVYLHGETAAPQPQ